VNGGYYGPPILFDESNAYEYCKFLSKRYPFHPWILGGDSDRYWNETAMEQIKSGKDPRTIDVVDFGKVTEAMARGLRDGEAEAVRELQGELAGMAKGYDTVITFHSAQGGFRAKLDGHDRSPSLTCLVWLPSAPDSSSSAQFPDADWLTFDCVQTGHHDSVPGAPDPDETVVSTTEIIVETVKDVTQAAVDTVEDTNGSKQLSEKDASEAVEAATNAQSGGGGMPMWFARSSYVPIRKMYETMRKDGKPRPVIDLEAHYENTHHWFSVSRH
jgi:hypothetical protein